MLEINKSIYENNKSNFEKLKKCINSLLKELKTFDI